MRPSHINFVCRSESLGLHITVTCQQLASIRSQNFDPTIGLEKPSPASKKLKSFVCDVLGMPAHTVVESCVTSRHTKLATSSVNDVILHRADDGSISAGRVWAHIGVGGEYLTLINKLKLRTADRSKSYAIWDVTAEHDIISTSDVLDPVIWNEYDDGVIRTMFPLDI